jgi:hypothetical protein
MSRKRSYSTRAESLEPAKPSLDWPVLLVVIHLTASRSAWRFTSSAIQSGRKLLPALLVCLPASLTAQESGDRSIWNDIRTVELVETAIDGRRHTWGDSTLQGFDLYAEGHVHFIADFGGGQGQQAVRADQVALDFRWRRGLGSLQEIVGRRETEWLPTRLHYHVDHLTLVVDNYGDRIQVGEGDEIRNAPHPLARDALMHYEFRLVDSLAMEVLGEWKRLYRLEVRPLDPLKPAVVGTMDLERESSALTRLAVSFTPASYIDPRLVTVSIELENGLVHGQYWLPTSQRVEIRRRMEFMELPFGSTIRASFRVLDYDLEPPGRGGVEPGHAVLTRPKSELERYAGWVTPELQAWPADVVTDSIRLAEVRSEAAAIAKGHYLGGDAAVRLFVPRLSSALRVRRAEGVFAGAGVRWDIDGVRTLSGTGGWAFGRGSGEVRGALDWVIGGSMLSVAGWVNELTDIGPFSAASGVVSTFGAAFRGDDWTDPYFRSGGSLGIQAPLGSVAHGKAAITWEEQEEASLELNPLGDTDARAVRPITEGTDLRIEIGAERSLGTWLGSSSTLSLTGELSALADFGYTRWVANLSTRPREPDATWSWEGTAGAGFGTGTLPEQRLLLLGGRGTVPGYEFRPFAGDVAAYANLAISRSLWHPWVRVRGLAAAGWTHLGSVGGAAAERFGATPTGNVRTSLGGGLSVFYDLVRFDVVRGLADGDWEWMVSVTPAFRAPL